MGVKALSSVCLIYGAGGFGREVAWLLRDYHLAFGRLEPLCFVDDDSQLHGTRLSGLPVIDLATATRLYHGAPMVLAIGAPQTRANVLPRVSNLGFEFPAIVHPSVKRSEYVSIGQGVLICASSILTTEVSVGVHTHINLGCTIGHDVTIGQYCTVSPGVHLSGWVHVGNRVFIGTGAVFINGTQAEPLTIGDGVTIGAGACVTRSVSPGETVVGVPARPIQRKD
jgi:sugar O-acyltransferase (sialic acid O-acetyltransferase NeuD family)